jgi:hypothetical protein
MPSPELSMNSTSRRSRTRRFAPCSIRPPIRSLKVGALLASSLSSVTWTTNTSWMISVVSMCWIPRGYSFNDECTDVIS